MFFHSICLLSANSVSLFNIFLQVIFLAISALLLLNIILKVQYKTLALDV